MDDSCGEAVSLATPHVSSGVSATGASAAAVADAVYVEHAPLLRAIALTRFHIPSADVDALVHDVFASYFVNAANVRALRPYLVGAICNASRQYWRKREAERAVFCDGVKCPAADDELLESVARKVRIAALLARLRPKCRELLRRYYLDGESTASIAASRATTANSVLVLLHGCRKSARAIFRALGEE